MQTGRSGTAEAARTLAWLVLIMSAGGLLLGRGGSFSPVLDVFSHFTGHLLGAVIGAAAALMLRRHVFAVLAVGALVTGLFHVALSAPPSQPPALAGFSKAVAAGGGDEASLNIISLNSWHANQSPEKILAYLKAERADVVVLIEFGPSKLDLLRRLSRLYPYKVHCADVWYCSMALLSRKPILKARARSPKGARPALVWARIAYGGHRSGALTVVGTHVYRPTRSPRRHEAHMKYLAKFVKGIKGPLVLAGDFNATPWSWSYQRLMRDSGLRPVGAMLPSWPAWPVAAPQFAIDHMFVSRGLSVGARGVGPGVGSDHLPIWAQITASRQ